VLEGPSDIVIEQALKFEFKTSNNQAECEAIIAGLNLAIDLEVKKLLCKSELQLVVGQLKEEFKVRETLLQQYFHFVQGLIVKFDEVTIQHIHWEHNTRADTTTRKKGLHRSIIYITMTKPSVGLEECMVTDTQPNWMTPIKKFLIDGTTKAHSKKTMKQKTTQFLLIDQDFYRRGYSHPLLKCLIPKQATYVSFPSKPPMSCERYTKGYATLIQELKNWHLKYCGQVIIGRPYKVIALNLCRSALSAKSMAAYLTVNLKILITFFSRGHL